MATVLVVEDAPDLVLYEARLLEAAGHRVIRCGGAPSPLAACPMLRFGNCPVADAADVIVFDCGMWGPIRHRTYGGLQLARAYRDHQRYGRLPMLVVGEGSAERLGGRGPLETIPKFSEPRLVVAAVERLLSRAAS